MFCEFSIIYNVVNCLFKAQVLVILQREKNTKPEISQGQFKKKSIHFQKKWAMENKQGNPFLF